MTWQLYTLIAVLSLSFARIFQKRISSYKFSDPYLSAILMMVFASLTALVLIFVNGFSFDGFGLVWPYFLLGGFIYGAANYTLLKAFTYTSASNVTILLTTSTIWTLIGSRLFLDQSLVEIQFIGIAAIILAGFIASYDGDKFQIDKGEKFAILAAVFYGLGLINDSLIWENYSDTSVYLFLTFLLPAVLLILLKPSILIKVKEKVNNRYLIETALMGFLVLLAVYSTMNAYLLQSNISLIATLNSTSTVLAILLAFFFLKEKGYIALKLVAAVLTVLGVWLLIV